MSPRDDMGIRSRRPRWDAWEYNLEVCGPNPWIVGNYLIIGYLGFYGKHVYLVRCLVCGASLTRAQDSIVRGARTHAKACSECWKTRKKEKIVKKKFDWEHEREAALMRIKIGRAQALVDIMPATSIEFIPEAKRFDGRRI